MRELTEKLEVVKPAVFSHKLMDNNTQPMKDLRFMQLRMALRFQLNQVKIKRYHAMNSLLFQNVSMKELKKEDKNVVIE